MQSLNLILILTNSRYTKKYRTMHIATLFSLPRLPKHESLLESSLALMLGVTCEAMILNQLYSLDGTASTPIAK